MHFAPSHQSAFGLHVGRDHVVLGKYNRANSNWIFDFAGFKDMRGQRSEESQLETLWQFTVKCGVLER